MGIPALPAELNKYIIEMAPYKTPRERVRTLKVMSCVCKAWNLFASESLEPLKASFASTLVSKYDAMVKGKLSFELLFDMLSTGKGALGLRATHLTYTAEIEQDILILCELKPEFIQSTLRTRGNAAPPLAIACENPQVPISIVEFLLKNGASKNSQIEVAGRTISLLDRIQRNLRVRIQSLDRNFHLIDQTSADTDPVAQRLTQIIELLK